MVSIFLAFGTEKQPIFVPFREFKLMKLYLPELRKDMRGEHSVTVLY